MTNQPLHIIRKWIAEGHFNDIQATSTDLSYDGVVLPLDLDTEFHPKKQTKVSTYTVGQIWMVLQHKDSKFTDYIADCKKNGLQNVLFTDKKPITEWLFGLKQSIEGIADDVEEPTKPAETQQPSTDSKASEEQKIENRPAAPALLPDEEETTTGPVIKINLESTPAPQIFKAPEVEYERIRTIDSMLICPFDFSTMLTKNEVFKKYENNTKLRSRDDRQELNGYQDDSIINQQRKSQFQNYIILVSRATSGCINNSNIEEFLNKSQWVPPREMPEKKRFVIDHEHSEKMRRLKYDVVADESLLSDNDWNKVVAIFIIGKKWQIRTYKPNVPQDLFDKVLGIYVGWDSEDIPAEIKTWRIQKCLINKKSRHNDPQKVGLIWRDIEEATERLKKRRND